MKYLYNNQIFNTYNEMVIYQNKLKTKLREEIIKHYPMASIKDRDNLFSYLYTSKYSII